MTRACLGPLPPPRENRWSFPAGACDAHAHVFGAYERFPLADERSYTPPVATPEQFIAHLDAFGLQRGVLVTASVYGTDNTALVDALRRYPARLRGVAVVDTQVTDRMLDDLSAAGVRAARFYVQRDGVAPRYRNPAGLAALRALAPALNARGWHAQIHVGAADLVALAPMLRALGVPLVFDHMAGAASGGTAGDEAVAARACLLPMLAEGRAWVKISGADRLGVPPYRDLDPAVAAFLDANASQVVWGSDWPHVDHVEQMPDDVDLVECMARWLPPGALRQRVLVDNPKRLYGFAD